MNNGLIVSSEEEEEEEDRDSIGPEVDIKSSVHSDIEKGGMRQSILSNDDEKSKELSEKKSAASAKTPKFKR